MPPETDRNDVPPDPLIGRTLDGRYRVLELIAAGGMGKVYKAQQLPLERICALKVLDLGREIEAGPEFHKRFLQEASVVAKLSHVNTVKLFDYGCTSDNVYYMSMEFLEGRTLQDAVAHEAPMEIRRVLAIARQIARSVREAHTHQVIHRDLKAANVFLVANSDGSEYVKVLDFGLVKNIADNADSLTQTGIVAGTPGYMAPEQIRGEEMTPAVDVYALGALMFQMFAGRTPFDAPRTFDIVKGHLEKPVPDLRLLAPTANVSDAVLALVLRCLEKTVEARYATMDAVLAAIEACAPPRNRTPGDPGMETGARLERASALPPPLVAEPAEEDSPVVISAPANRSASYRVIAPIAFGLTVLVGGSGVLIARRTQRAPIGSLHATPGGVRGTETTRSLRLEVTSDPPGADVLDGRITIGHTPLDLRWTGADADPMREHMVTVRLAGFRDATATLRGPALYFATRLERVAAAPSQTPARPTATQAPAARPRPLARTPGHRRPDEW